MKKIYTIVLALFFFAFAKAEKPSRTAIEEAPTVNWTGTYDTSFGEVILHQKGNSVVGTYRGLGAIRSTELSGNSLTVEFDNKANTGYAKFVKTANGFKGSYSWDNKRNEGQWNGTKKANAPQNSLQGAWNTNFWGIEFVHNSKNIVAGHYGNVGGKIWGTYNPSTKTLKGQYMRNPGAKKERFEMRFSGNSFSGKYNQTAMGSWTGTRKASVSTAATATITQPGIKGYDLKVTLNSVKRYKKPLKSLELSTLYMSSGMSIRGNEVISVDHAYNKSRRLLHNRTVTNTAIKPNKFLVFEIREPLSRISDINVFTISTKYRYKTKLSRSIKTSNWKTRDINLKEVLKYLTGVTNTSNYTIAPGQDGRYRFPNTEDTFWLEIVGGKRIIRGYGDIRHFGEDFGFGYHYTIELEEKL